MRVSEAIDFLGYVKEAQGDIKIQSITGFWVKNIPATGEKVVVPSVGDSKSVEDVMVAFREICNCVVSNI